MVARCHDDNLVACVYRGPIIKWLGWAYHRRPGAGFAAAAAVVMKPPPSMTWQVEGDDDAVMG